MHKEDKDNDNKWQIAFWLLGSISCCWLLILSNCIIANDRLRAVEDIRIKNELEKKLDTFQEILLKKNDEIIQFELDLQRRMTKIETKIEILYRNKE